MVVVVEFIEAEAKHQAALKMALLLLARGTLEKKAGCQSFDVGQDDLDGASFLLYQIYSDRDAYLAHIEQPSYAEHRLLVDPWVKSRRQLTYDLISQAGTA